MSEEQQSALQQATDSANAGNFSEALELSRSILVTDPTNSSAKLIEAISLSQLGNVRDASEAFAQAMSIAPDDLRIQFNAAVHEKNAGNIEAARSLAENVLRVEPTHQGALDLMAQMGPAIPSMSSVSYPREMASGYEPEHEGIAFVKKLGPTWTGIGIVLALASLSFFILTIAVLAPNFGEIAKASQSQDQTRMNELFGVLKNPIVTVLSYVVLGGNLIWTIMDIIHRRGNFLWLLPHVPCTCCGAGFLTQGLYLLLGRK